MGVARSSFVNYEMKRAQTAFLRGPKENVMTLNNQSTMLLEYQIKLSNDQVTKLVSFILHDNRIFVFEKIIHFQSEELHQLYLEGNDLTNHNPLQKRKDSQVSAISTDASHSTWKLIDQGTGKEFFDTAVSTPSKDLIQNVLTSPGFRLLSFMYLFFQLVDDTSFIAIVVSTVYYGALGSSDPSNDNLTLYFIIGLEIFYDILLAVNKYWILQRVSFYIGIVLFIAYYSVLLQMSDQMSEDRYVTLLALLSLRLIFFLLEECVDIYIDCSLHNVLLAAQNCRKNNYHKIDGSVQLYHTAICSWYYEYRGGCYHCTVCSDFKVEKTWFPWNVWNWTEKRMEHILNAHPDYASVIEQREKDSLLHNFKHGKCMVPEGYIYKGSFFAWGLYSIYNWDDEDPSIFHADDFNQYFTEWRFALIFIPGVITLFIAVSVWILAFAGILVMFLLSGAFALSFKLLSCCFGNLYPFQTTCLNWKIARNYVRELKRI